MATLNFSRPSRLKFHHTILLVLSICMATINMLFGQQFITFPVGTPAEIDGILHDIEWSDAASAEIKVNINESVKVYYKASHDTLYFAYAGRLESGNIWFPEICFDAGNDKTLVWDADDWWFHVSASDCDHVGAPGVYSNCAPEQEDWLATPNFIQGPPLTDSVEIAIPMSKIHLSPKDTFGISFNVTNTFSAWKFWPDEAKLGQPSTWATASISQTTSADTKPLKMDIEFNIFPNPNEGFFTIASSRSFSQVRMYDLQGRMLTSLYTIEGANHLELDLTSLNLPQGIYILCIDQMANRVDIRN